MRTSRGRSDGAEEPKYAHPTLVASGSTSSLTRRAAGLAYRTACCQTHACQTHTRREYQYATDSSFRMTVCHGLQFRNDGLPKRTACLPIQFADLTTVCLPLQFGFDGLPPRSVLRGRPLPPPPHAARSIPQNGPTRIYVSWGCTSFSGTLP